MNREIKFRAWDKTTNQMLYRFDLMITENFSALAYNLPQSDCDVILMQYTGLKDKNGKEIYEGDIVKTVQGVYKMQGVVKYSPPSWYVYDNLGANVLEYYEWEQLEIVGNIHENSELLKA